MNAGQATQWGLTLAAVIGALGGLLTAWLNRRSTVETTGEQARQHDINLIIKTLQEDVTGLRQNVSGHETTIAKLEEENRQCWADRAQLTNQVTYQRMQLDDMRRRVAQLEKPDQA